MDPDSYSSASSAMTLLADSIASGPDTLRAVKDHILRSLPPNPSSMDTTFHQIAASAVATLLDKQADGQYRIVIAIGGTPGSGKTTMASRVEQILNNAYAAVLAAKSPPSNPHSSALYTHANMSSSTLGSELSDVSFSTLQNAMPIPAALPSHPDVTAAAAAANYYAQLNFGAATPGNVFMADDHNADDDADDQQLNGACCDDFAARPTAPDTPFHPLGGGAGHHDTACCPLATDPLIPASTNAAAAAFPTHGTQFAATVPMDGFHLTRAQLDRFPDPKAAHQRRGSPWTFDAQGAVAMAKQLRASCFPPPPAPRSSSSSSTPFSPPPLYFPAFDHAVKDPQPDAIAVAPTTRIVILEGLYTMLDQAPWNQIPALVDLRWFIEVPLHVTKKRLARRHLESGIVKTLEEGNARVDTNDALNAILIEKELVRDVFVNNRMEHVEMFLGCDPSELVVDSD